MSAAFAMVLVHLEIVGVTTSLKVIATATVTNWTHWEFVGEIV